MSACASPVSPATVCAETDSGTRIVHLVDPKPYMKFSLLLDCLRRFELAAWFDSDTAVVDFSRTLTDIRSSCKHQHFVVSGDNCGPAVRGHSSGINTGFMLVHHDAAGQYALKALLERTRDAEFVKRSFWWDQHALMDMIENNPAHQICVTPRAALAHPHPLRAPVAARHPRGGVASGQPRHALLLGGAGRALRLPFRLRHGCGGR